MYLRLIVMVIVSVWLYRFGFWWGTISLLVSIAVFVGDRYAQQDVIRQVKVNIEKELNDDTE